MRLVPPVPRWLRGLLAVSGVVHVLAPGTLLAVARWAYPRVLAAEFRPREGATRRVRLVGVAFVCIAALAPGPEERARRRRE